ncbi:hypothetical protein ACJIZ3_013273 [Penstemon smallii]|uniref:Helitron helicase-like domain-containing protein n=1 Tax=Penstemon smallii TaxID=265156 RepID=A0ABD3UPD6_9LAMI
MDSRSDKKDLANQRKRSRRAALSVHEKETLAVKRRADYAHRRVPVVPASSAVGQDIWSFNFVDEACEDSMSAPRQPVNDLFHMSYNIEPIASSSLHGVFQVGESSSAAASVGIEVGPQVLSPHRANRRARACGRFARIREVPTIPWVLPAAAACLYCGAHRFFREGAAFCCSNGQICLPQPAVCAILHFLFTDMSEIACEFRRRARTYNNAFAFTSIGMSIDSDSWWAKEGIYALKVFGQVFHYMNPIDGSANTRDLLQLFFLDTVNELDSEVVNAKGLRADVMSIIVDALSNNPYSIFFKRLRSWDNLSDAHVVLRRNPCMDQRTYNLPTVNEVAAIWRDTPQGDLGCERDIRVYTDGSRSHKVRYHYGCYDPLQYPILFPYGESGWHSGIKKKGIHRVSASKKQNKPCAGFDSVDPTNLASAEDVLLQEEEGKYLYCCNSM